MLSHSEKSAHTLAHILSGRECREALMPALIEKVRALKSSPTLMIIQVGDRSDSTAFIRAKKSFAKKVGVNEKHIQIPENVVETALISIIRQCNADPSIHGIVLQLPLPHHLNAANAIEMIDPKKDVDAINGAEGIIPGTARGIRELLAFNSIGLKGKKVTVVGRSTLVGTPIAEMCRHEGATVTVCHRGTKDLAKDTKSADILIVAAGRPGLIKNEHVKAGQVIIDVGISRLDDDRLVGDVDFEAVKDVVSAITPVPGGVGPMTVLALFENLVDLCSS